MEMTAYVGGIQKFSTGDGPGIRTTVFLQGCTLACKWCHNPELISSKNRLMFHERKCIGCKACIDVCPNNAISLADEGKIRIDRDICVNCETCTEVCYAEALSKPAIEMTVDDVMHQVALDKGYYDTTGGGLTISGGECLLNGEFTLELVKAANSLGISTAIETSGIGNYDMLYEICKRLDHILYDLKSIDDSIHIEYTGVSNEIILRHLKWLASKPEIKDKIQIRMPLISGINDSDELITATIEFLLENDLRNVALIPYHEMGISKSKSLDEEYCEFSTPSDERMVDIWRKLTNNGIKTEIPGRDMKEIMDIS